MINWGIIGLGKISRRFIQSLAHSKQGRLYGAASFTAGKREAFLAEHPGTVVYKSYHGLLHDPHVDAVYIAVRHADHYRWAREALLKGKAVLCEKPAALLPEQTRELCALSREKQVFFMEAMKTRFIPAVDELKQMLEGRMIGEVSRIETTYCGTAAYKEHHYLFDDVQGGALYDIGIYNIASVLDYIRSETAEISAVAEYRYGVDVHAVAELVFASGQTAKIEVAIDRDKDRDMIITGSRGTIYVKQFSRPEVLEVRLHDGTEHRVERGYEHDDFYGEIEEVHRCMGHGAYESDRMSHEDSIRCIDLLYEIREKARTGGTK